MSDFYKLDINRFLNYKIINSDSCDQVMEKESDPEPYRAVYHDELFKPDNLPSAGNEYSFEGIPFIFPLFSKEGYDNVCCEGQKIDLPAKEYTKIHVIGFCECEGFTEKFTFISPDSTTEASVEIFLFNSWKGIEHWSHERNPEMCRNVFLATTVTRSPRGVYCSSQSIENVSFIETPDRNNADESALLFHDENVSTIKTPDSNITDSSVILPEGKITSVILPFCPMMHIFSITLESIGV